MKRTLLLVTTVLIVAALAIPQAGAVASQQAVAAAAKKGKPPKDPEPVFAIQMAISDPTGGNQLKGDGLDRQDPSMDADGDGFGDLTGAFPGLDIFYQDHRIDLDGPYADPCVGSRHGTDDGFVQVDLDRGNVDVGGFLGKNCNVALDYTTDPPSLFADDPTTTELDEADGRTFTLEFVSGGPLDPNNLDLNDPVHCVCHQFRYLADDDPDEEIWGAGAQWGTGFKWTSNGCSVTLSTAGVVTDDDASRHTANAIFSGLPFKTAAKKKGKPGPTSGGLTTDLDISFRADRRVPGDLRNYIVESQQEDLPITGADDIRTITATDQLFDLWLRGAPGNSPACSGFKLPLQIKFQRFDVTPSG